jgi:colicin import membrane protein
MNEVNSLVVIERPTALSVFTSKEDVDRLIDKIEKMARAEMFSDVGTAKARKDIASLAYKVAQTKAYIDAVGKDLVTEMKELPKKVDDTRRQIRDRLDALRDEIRAPLDAWEAEQERIAKEKAEAEAATKARAERIAADIAAFVAAPTAVFGKSSSVIEAQLNGFSQMRPMPEQFDDRWDEATRVWAAAIDTLTVMLQQTKEREQFDQEQRDKRIAAEAEERARKAAEQQVIDARLAQERAEQARIDAEERAKRAAEDAAARERARIQEEERAAAAEAERRARNIKHKKAVNNAALQDLTSIGLSEEQGKAVIVAIAAGKVSHITITY